MRQLLLTQNGRRELKRRKCLALHARSVFYEGRQEGITSLAPSMLLKVLIAWRK